MSDSIKHLLICAIISAITSCVTTLLIWLSLIAISCEELMEYLLSPIWFSGIASALTMGMGKEYGDECAKDNKWSWDDVTFDIIGAVIGASLICITIKLI